MSERLLRTIYGPIVARVVSDRDPRVRYDVRLAKDGRYSCSCTTWLFRHTCSHAEDAQAQGLTEPIACT